MNRPAWFVAGLLLMLAGLMTAHLGLLRNNMIDCDLYLKFLYSRLERTKIGSPEALALRKELQETYSGKTTECANMEADFSEASSKYIGVILALLGGAGVAAGTTKGAEMMQSRRRSQEDEPPSRTPPDA